MGESDKSDIHPRIVSDSCINDYFYWRIKIEAILLLHKKGSAVIPLYKLEKLKGDSKACFKHFFFLKPNEKHEARIVIYKYASFKGNSIYKLS